MSLIITKKNQYLKRNGDMLRDFPKAVTCFHGKTNADATLLFDVHMADEFAGEQR
jgi:hypothetical protein